MRRSVLASSVSGTKRDDKPLRIFMSNFIWDAQAPRYVCPGGGAIWSGTLGERGLWLATPCYADDTELMARLFPQLGRPPSNRYPVVTRRPPCTRSPPLLASFSDVPSATRQLLMGRCYLMLIVRISCSPRKLHAPHMV